MTRSIRLIWPLAAVLCTAFVLTMEAQSPLPEQIQLQAPGAIPETATSPAGLVDETPEVWFVELTSPPTADGTSRAQTSMEKDDFRVAAGSVGLKFKERYAFDVCGMEYR
jgi:hypothetical protein